MTLSLIAALVSLLSYGTGSVLQAVAARRSARAEGMDPRLLMRMASQGVWVVGLGLDVVGVVASIVALRHLPLFVVQAAIASSVAVTAVLAARVFRARLAPGEWAGIAGVIVGLALLAAAAGPEDPPHTSTGLRVGMVVFSLIVVGAGALAGRVQDKWGAPLLGGLAGIAFGVGNTAIRVVTDLSPAALVKNPAAYAAAISAIMGVLLFTTALQRGAVTTATGVMTATETLLPAGFGLAVLGEGPKHGWGLVAVLGFVVTVGGAVALSRFGEAEIVAGEPADEEDRQPEGDGPDDASQPASGEA